MNKTIKMLTSDSLTSASDIILMDREGNNVLVISFEDGGLVFSGITDPRWLATLVEGVMFQQGAAQEVGFVLELSTDDRLGDLSRLHLVIVDAEDETYIATIILSSTSAEIELTADVITATPRTSGWYTVVQSEHDGVRADTASDFLKVEPRVHSFTVVSPSSIKLTTVVRQ